MTLTTVSTPTTKTTQHPQHNQTTRRIITSQASLRTFIGAVMLFGSSLTTQTAKSQNWEPRRTDVGAVLCRSLNGSLRVDDPATKFERAILKEIGVDINHPQKERLISEFFNRFNSKLTCGEETTVGWREREHILKRSISANMYHFLEKVGSSRKYSMDFNYYEIIDGEKETILDYLDKILADDGMMEGYDRDELEELVGMIEDVGGKRGRGSSKPPPSSTF